MTWRQGVIQTCVFLLLAPVLALGATGSSRAIEAGSIPVAATAAFAKQVERSLAKQGAKVAIVARAGRPPHELPAGVEYTHVGLAVYSTITTADGRQIPGYATYNLYQSADDADTSELVQDYMLDFFIGVDTLKAGIIIPHERLQAKLLRLITNGTWKMLHNPRYSLMANPYNDDYQNCTEFVLNVTQSAIYDSLEMNAIKASIKAHFESYKVRRNPFAIMLGGLFSQEIAISDHPHTFETTTFASLRDYMKSFGLARTSYTLFPVN